MGASGPQPARERLSPLMSSDGPHLWSSTPSAARAALRRFHPRFLFGRSSLCLRRFYSSSGSTSLPFMEVLKATANQTSLASKSAALRTEKKSYSYAQLIESSRHISNHLCSNGLDSTENGHLREAWIGILGKPSAEFAAGLLGTWLSGGVTILLALSYPEAELLHVMNDSDIAMILSSEDYQDLMQKIATQCATKFSLIPQLYNNSLENIGLGVEKLCNMIQGPDFVKGEEPALILYTSGTTGKPKGSNFV